jgi:hypothetical protein
MTIELELIRLALEIVKNSNLGLKEMTEMQIQIMREDTANRIQFMWLNHRLEQAERKAELGTAHELSSSGDVESPF